MIDITGINKAEILAALYNNAKPIGMGFLHYTPEPMTIEAAENLLKENQYFDYLKGRVMKVNLSGDQLRTELYDRDNGTGAAAKALAHLLPKPQTSNPVNDMDQWEQEEAAKQLEIIKGEDKQYAALPDSEKQRLNEDRTEAMERFQAAADASEEE